MDQSVTTALPHGVISLLMTDIEGSSALWDMHARTMQATVQRHDELVAQVVKQNCGYVIKSKGEGDSHFCVFQRPEEAVAAALALQRAFNEELWSVETPIKVRVAVHTGEAELRGEDYRGSTVNCCARIRQSGHGGQTLISKATHDLVTTRLSSDVITKDLGPYQLAGIRSPVHLIQVSYPDLQDDFPPLRVQRSLQTNLLRQLTSFVGREKDLVQVRNLLAKNPILTLTGAGGAGKTRLATEVAATLLPDYPDGIWFVDLAPLSSHQRVMQSVATVVLPESATNATERVLMEYLRHKRALIVLDNCEHVLESAGPLSLTLLRSCSNLRILATSREALSIPGESVYLVPTLAVPDARRLPTLKRLQQIESVRLFTERAAAVKPGFDVNASNAIPVSEICARLDGIPLLIELAAAWVRTIPVEEIAERLNRLLSSPANAGADRHKTVTATMDWSFNLLTDQERILLRRLSVFSGGWTLNAAESVCGGAGIDEFAVMETLARLVDKSLVVYADKSRRYRLLETIRQYAQEKLRSAGEEEPYQRAHRDYFADSAHSAKQYLESSEQQKWLVRLENEHDNFRVALRNTQNPKDRLEIAISLGRFWYVRGHWSEARSWLESAINNGSSVPPELRAEALNLAGIFATVQQDYLAAVNYHQQCLDIRRGLGVKINLAGSLTNLGSAMRHAKDISGAKTCYDEALVLYRETGNNRGTATVAANMGNLSLLSHDYAGAEQLFRECVSVYTEIADEWYLAGALHNLAESLFLQGRYSEAEQIFLNGVQTEVRLEDWKSATGTLIWLAYAACGMGKYTHAATLFAAAERNLQAQGESLPQEMELVFSERLAELKKLCEDSSFDKHRQLGASLTLQDAIELALQRSN
jgi:predicted ATPase/class 3 adenylate cyclase